MGNKDPRVARIWKAIDDILWTHWDPIGIHGNPSARDEYAGYIGGIFRLLEERATENQVAAHLHKIETQAMGLPGRLERCQDTAKKLMQTPL